MKITRAFLVLVVAVSVTHGQNNRQSKFPDLLAPFRGIFGRTTPGPTGQPLRQANPQGSKDLSGAATNKPYNNPSASPAGEDDGGFRPSLFGSGGGYGGGGPSPHDQQRPHSHGYSPGRGPQGAPHHGRQPHHPPRPGPGTNRPTRQETGSAYGGFGPFGLESGGGRPGGGGHSPFGSEFGGFGPDFGFGGEGPQSSPQGHAGHGYGHGEPGRGPHGHRGPGGPRPSHAPGGGPNRFRGGPGPQHHDGPHDGPSHFRGGPGQQHHDGPHGGPPHHGGPHGGPQGAPSSHHGGPGGPLDSPRGPHDNPRGPHDNPRGPHDNPRGPLSGGKRPFQGSRPGPPEYSPAGGSHYYGNEHQQGPSSATPTFGPGGEEYPEQFEGGNRETREPQIITADDVQRPGGNGLGGSQFDDVYNNPGSNFGPPTTNPSFGLGFSAASGAPGNPYGRQVPSFAPQSDSSSGGLIRSNPLRPSTRPFSNGFLSSSEEGLNGYPRQPTAATRSNPYATFSRPVHGSYQASAEDIHYGRPMMMSASSRQSRVIRAGPRVGRRKKNTAAPIQLVSPKDPNYIRPSASTLDTATAASDLSPAATGGHGGGGDFHHGDDRILYHVAGHQGPYSYRFGYDTGKGLHVHSRDRLTSQHCLPSSCMASADPIPPRSHNRQFRHEEKDGKGYVKGRYGFYDKSGKLNIINYQAHPEHGYHAERGHTHGHY